MKPLRMFLDHWSYIISVILQEEYHMLLSHDSKFDDKRS